MNHPRLDVDAISTVARTLALRCWSNAQVDADLRETLDACLTVIGSAATMAWFRRERVTLAHAVPESRWSEKRLLEIASDVFRDNPNASLVQKRYDSLEVVAVPIREPRAADCLDSRRELAGYAALCFSRTGEDGFEGRRESAALQSIAALLFQVLQHRARLFLPFSPRLATRYWTDSVLSSANRLTPPFSRECDTVTLGLDLRKSTFCMAQASNLAAFAEWLRQMVRILLNITHLYDGVFDKFTGDGILAHFLPEASAAVAHRSAVVSSVACAVAMQRAMEQHLKRLKKMLRNPSAVVGGAIGIDFAPAHWSLDHRHNPMTVGPGVVNACRLMDRAKAGGVLLGNLAYEEIEESQWQAVFDEVPVNTKEVKEDMQATAWELRTAMFPFADASIVQAICESAWAQSAFDIDE